MSLNQLNSRRGRARVYRPLAEPLEDRRLLATLLALSDTNTLVRFDSTTLLSIGAPVPITGVGVGEQVRAIDVRPSTGALYAVTTGLSGTQPVARLYLISIDTTVATAQRVNPTANFLVNSEQIGIDFNPVSDRLRVVTGGSDLSIAVNPETGTVQYDPSPNFAVGYTPPPVQLTPDITAVAYGNNVSGATTTTLYGYEYNENDLVTIAFATGAVTKVGDSTVIAEPGQAGLTGLDIEGTSTTAFAALQLTGSTNRLLSINLANGAGTDLGAIPVPAGSFVRDLAVAPVPRVQFEFADYQFDENVGNATGRVRRTGDLTGSVTVTFQTTTTGTATPGTDFTTTTNTLTFAAGQEFATFSVAITDEALPEAVETIGVALTNPSTGSTLGSLSTATLTIRSNDPDTTAPTVVSVEPRIIGRRFNRRIESILVTFSEPISPTRAQDLANYQIRLAGRFRRSSFTTISIRSVAYSESTRSVTILPNAPFRINRASQLVIRGTPQGGIADLAGNFLAGGDDTRRLS